MLGIKDDFYVTPVTKYKSMDFDLKRKPVRSSFKAVYPVIENVKYEIANFSTEPYYNVEEFCLYRQQHENVIGKSPAETTKVKKTKSSSKRTATVTLTKNKQKTKSNIEHCLRTINDWDTYFFPRIAKAKRRKKRTVKTASEASTRACGVTITKKKVAAPSSIDAAARKVYNCMYAFRAGKISIPLIEQYSPREFIKALNRSKISKTVFTYEGYKNYSRKERWPDVLKNGTAKEIEAFLQQQEPLLSKLQNLTPHNI